jgi:hypothetical protein
VPAGIGGGVFRSIDRGVHGSGCTNTGSANPDVLPLASDYGGKQYAVTENGVYASDDCDTRAAINGGLP